MSGKIIRFGVSMDQELLKKFDKLIKRKGYTNRSEAIRDIIRKEIISEKIRDPHAESMGTLTMIYNHHTRNLTDKLLDIQHDHIKEILSATHIHIDHHNCMEVLILRGKAGDIQKLADNIKAIKGIKNGELILTKISH